MLNFGEFGTGLVCTILQTKASDCASYSFAFVNVGHSKELCGELYGFKARKV